MRLKPLSTAPVVVTKNPSPTARAEARTERGANELPRLLSRDSFELGTPKGALGGATTTPAGLDQAARLAQLRAEADTLTPPVASTSAPAPGLTQQSVPLADPRRAWSSWSGEDKLEDTTSSDGSEKVVREERYREDDGSETVIRTSYERDADGKTRERQDVRHTDANGHTTSESTTSTPVPDRDGPPPELTVDAARAAAQGKGRGLTTPTGAGTSRATSIAKGNAVNPQREGREPTPTAIPKGPAPVADPTGPDEPQRGGKTTVVGGRPPRNPLG